MSWYVVLAIILGAALLLALILAGAGGAWLGGRTRDGEHR